MQSAMEIPRTFVSSVVYASAPHRLRCPPRKTRASLSVTRQQTTPTRGDDPALADKLLAAHDTAVQMFAAIESKGLLIPGRSEEEINQEIFELVAAEFGTRKHWHTRLVRVGQNTIHPIHVKAPNLVLQEDDIAFIDLGPVFGDIEADFARSYIIGNDSEKLKLNAALPLIFAACKQYYLSDPDMTGAELYAFVCKTCKEYGYEYGNAYCAHLLGKFAHKMDFGLEHSNFSRPECDVPMSAPASNGWHRFWVLEIHAVQDPAIGRYAGFYEDLLNLPTQ